LQHQLKFRVLEEQLAVCQLAAGSRVPEWAVGAGFFCITQTHEELSIVCDETLVPQGVRNEKGWAAMKLEGPFPFALTGVLTSFLQPLADGGIPIFVVSTFDTDYVLMKRERLTPATAALKVAGHVLVGPTDHVS
jgi:hypothetical protein